MNFVVVLSGSFGVNEAARERNGTKMSVTPIKFANGNLKKIVNHRTALALRAIKVGQGSRQDSLTTKLAETRRVSLRYVGDPRHRRVSPI